MRILILSNYPWKNNNSFGNTYSSIFSGVHDTEIAHIYMYSGIPDSVPNVTRYYQILERDVMKSVFKRSMRVGKRVAIDREVNVLERETNRTKESNTSYSKLLSFGRKHHWHLLLWARELAWKYGMVDFDGLMAFVRDFNPDIFFLPFSNVFFTNRLALYIKDHYDVPMVMEMAMDHYSLHRISFNPLFWIDRFAKRRMIRKVAKKSEHIFVVSTRLKQLLEKDLGIPCTVLYKTPDSNRSIKPYVFSDATVSFLFTGNIFSNRWKSLAMLAKELKKHGFGHLSVYTASPITRSIKRALEVEGYSNVYPAVSQMEVIKLQNEADVLVHAEGFDEYNKSLVRCAISTKIMDYLSVGRCILAIGPPDIASIEYLSENNVALIAKNEEELSRIITLIQRNRQVIEEYAKKGLEYSKVFLSAPQMRQQLYDKLESIITNYKCN